MVGGRCLGISGDLPTGFAIMAIWVAGGICALCGALSYAELGAAMREAFTAYRKDVEARAFPGSEHSYTMTDELLGLLGRPWADEEPSGEFDENVNMWGEPRDSW